MARIDRDTTKRLTRIEAKVMVLMRLVERSLGKTIDIGTMQMARIDDLVAKVKEQSTVVGSVEVLINGLKADFQAVRDELAYQGLDTAKMDEAIASLDQNTSRLQAAVATGTAAEEPEHDDIHALSM